jgi:hypothetical protein
MTEPNRLRTNSTPGVVPTTAELELDELLYNTFDGKLYTKRDNGTASIVEFAASVNFQPADADLTAIAALTGTSGLLRKTAANTWSLDTASYLTGNQSITVSGDVTGTGTTSIALTLADSSVTNAKVAAAAAIAGSKITPDFGAQNVATTGTITGGALIPSSATLPALGMYRPAANTLGWATNSIERLRIIDNGAVVIGALGAPSSTTTLLLVGNASGPGAAAFIRLNRAEVVTSGDVRLGNLSFSDINDEQAASIVAFSDAAWTSGSSQPTHLRINTASTGAALPAERMRITSTGNVLIGNTTGTERLTVTGNVQAIRFIGEADTSTKLSSARSFTLSGDITGTVSSDLTSGASITTAIGSGVIVDADVSSTAAIALSKLATGALPTAITVASANLVDGTIANVDVSASAAIAGSKIAPDFGAQNILTTGTITGASINPTGTTVPAVGLFRPATNVLAWATNTLERMRVDSLGRLLVGTAASTNFLGTGFGATIQAKETASQFALGLQRATDDISGPSVAFRKTRSTTDGGVTIVQDNDVIGSIRFVGTDGVGVIECARIEARINGTPGVNDMPGRLAFFTTPAGSSSASERVRIDSSGNVLIGNTTGTERLSVTGKIQLTATGNSYMVGTNNVVGSRKTGWAAATGTATRTTFATSTVTTADLAQRVKALIDDLISHGLIGT